MSLDNYEGKTFVAYLDISGFKEKMERREAWSALDRFYNAGYDTLQSQNRSNSYEVEGIFISDCGILFVRNSPNNLDQVDEFKSILQITKAINEQMRDSNCMLTNSIAWGEFRYQHRRESGLIQKSPIYGIAYLSAYYDQKGNPQIQPGQCRILVKGMPNNVKENILQNSDDEIFRMIRKRDGDRKHYYYYWMVNTPSEIKRFEQNYKNACASKYEAILRALKGIHS